MENNNRSRRQFLSDSSKTVIGITAGVIAGGSLLESCSGAKNAVGSKLKTGFTQEPLPYSYNALDKAIDGTTMEIHYTKHAATYATNLRDAAKAEGVDTNRPLEEA